MNPRFEASITVLWSLSERIAQTYQLSPDIADAVKRRDAGYLALRGFDYEDSQSVSNLIADRQVCAFFSKLESLDIGIDKETVAYNTWLGSEELCKETNILLSRCGVLSKIPRLTTLLEHVRRYVQRVLGRCPSIDELHLTFGNGATTSVTRKQSNPQYKMGSGFHCSERLAHSAYLPSLLRELPHWTSQFSEWSIDEDGWLVETVPVRLESGRLTFVPKNCKTHRAITVEPTLNGLLQQGIRKAMERRMARFGLATRDQSINRSRARLGSVTGLYATIDLSSASDTIATNLVKAVMPDDWFRLLDDARTQTVLYKGTEYSQEKFCSMGNAFTFPLETLLFSAICSYHTKDFTVYGDDICVPSTCYEDLSRSLQLAGFKVNRAKSFSSGPFRESCGGDYFKGIDIRPVYVKHLGVIGLYTLANWFNRTHDEALRAIVIGAIPHSLRFFGPDRLGDCCIHSDTYPAKWDRYAQSRKVTVLVTKEARAPSLYPGDWITPLYLIYSQGTEPSKGEIEFRGDRPFWPVPVDDGTLVRMSISIS